MPKNLQNNVLLWKFMLVERRLTQFVRVPPYEILVFLMNYTFWQNEIILWGKKRTHNWEESSVFALLYANT